jgi:hypothetical protein
MSAQPGNDIVASYLRKNGLFRTLRFEGISILATMFAMCFTSGYVYLQIYYSRLGVPVERLGLELYAYAVYGGVNILVIFVAMLVAMAAVALTTMALFFIENPDRQSTAKSSANFSEQSIFKKTFVKRLKHAKDSILIFLIVSLCALIFWCLWKLTVSQSIDRAEIAAFKDLKQCKPVLVSLKNTDKIYGCIVAESNDTFYLVSKVSEDGAIIEFDKLRILKSNVNSLIGRSTILKNSK